MQLSIQPSIRQRQRATELNGIGGAVNTVDDVLVTEVRAAENANKIFKQQPPKTFFIFRGVQYVCPVANY
jgi:hypothetical protein